MHPIEAGMAYWAAASHGATSIAEYLEVLGGPVIVAFLNRPSWTAGAGPWTCSRMAYLIRNLSTL
ncbi:MAG: hypothetical protein CM15mP125_3970 [Gammaproteobacteria bacterium]|nr:MAG: hypothetical protein CM15mP125_3970 [Gammaproteobacteria bacterium]